MAWLLGATALPAADTFTLGSSNGNAGDVGVRMPLLATNDQPIQGFSLSATYDPSRFSLTDLSIAGTETETVSPGGIPDYFSFQIDPVAGTVVAGVIFGFNPVPPLNQIPEVGASPDTPVTLIELVFDFSPTALPGDYAVTLVDGLGNPPVDNVYSNDGVTIHPALTPGVLTVNNLHRFYFDPMLAVPGGSITAVVKYDHEDPMGGFVISISYDNTVLTLVPPASAEGWYSGLDLANLLAPDTIEFFLPSLDPNIAPGIGWASLAAQFDFLPPFNGQAVPVGMGHTLVRFPFTVVNNPGLVGLTTPVHFDDTFGPPGSPPSENLVVVPPGIGIAPILEDGTVEITDLPPFSRGNVNGDFTFDVADAIFIINYLFVQGPPPGCMDSADSNDDGLIDISDSITIINFLFVDGPPPPNPFPGCGLDGTPDAGGIDLGCLSPSGC